MSEYTISNIEIEPSHPLLKRSKQMKEVVALTNPVIGKGLLVMGKYACYVTPREWAPTISHEQLHQIIEKLEPNLTTTSGEFATTSIDNLNRPAASFENTGLPVYAAMRRSLKLKK